MEETKFCPQCPNHCPQEALQCGRGQRYFGQTAGVDPEEVPHGRGRHPEPHGPWPDLSTPEGQILDQLGRCGHCLHHGGCTPEALLAPLSREERLQLAGLLAKLDIPERKKRH